MGETAQIAMAVGVPALGVVIWLIRLEGRVNTHEAIQTQMRADLTYIRSRIDAALNGHHGE